MTGRAVSGGVGVRCTGTGIARKRSTEGIDTSQRSRFATPFHSLCGCLAENGIEASVGTVGDSYTLADTVIGLFKTEVI